MNTRFSIIIIIVLIIVVGLCLGLGLGLGLKKPSPSPSPSQTPSPSPSFIIKQNAYWPSGHILFNEINEDQEITGNLGEDCSQNNDCIDSYCCKANFKLDGKFCELGMKYGCTYEYCCVNEEHPHGYCNFTNGYGDIHNDIKSVKELKNELARLEGAVAGAMIEKPDIQNEDVDCWNDCDKEAGPCPNFCGTDGGCCKRNDKTGGCFGGCTNYHCCTNEINLTLKTPENSNTEKEYLYYLFDKPCIVKNLPNGSIYFKKSYIESNSPEDCQLECKNYNNEFGKCDAFTYYPPKKEGDKGQCYLIDLDKSARFVLRNTYIDNPISGYVDNRESDIIFN